MLCKFIQVFKVTDDEKELKDQRVVTMMSPSELEAIDDWMFQNRIRSRGEAIRRLCQIGVAFDRAGPAISREVDSLDREMYDFNEVFSSYFAKGELKRESVLAMFELRPRMQASLAGIMMRLSQLFQLAVAARQSSDTRSVTDLMPRLKAELIEMEHRIGKLRESQDPSLHPMPARGRPRGDPETSVKVSRKDDE